MHFIEYWWEPIAWHHTLCNSPCNILTKIDDTNKVQTMMKYMVLTSGQGQKKKSRTTQCNPRLDGSTHRRRLITDSKMSSQSHTTSKHHKTTHVPTSPDIYHQRFPEIIRWEIQKKSGVASNKH